MAHGNQGTGGWKGNRDKHEKVQSNSAKNRSSWTDMGKRTNSERNQSRSESGRSAYKNSQKGD